MKNIYNTIKSNQLFDGIKIEDYDKLLSCLNARTKNYKKNEIVLLMGNHIDKVGIVLNGSVKIMKEDFNGNQTILTEISQTGLFGEVFACAGINHSPVTIIAAENCEVLFFDFNKVITTCSRPCAFHTLLVENMLKIIAKKNLMLNQKIDILSRRTLREKLLCFFEYQRKGASKFTINFNREELASYLCTNRSAMSAELSRMQEDGIIIYSKNTFEIL